MKIRSVLTMTVLLFLCGVGWSQESPEIVVQRGHTSKVLAVSPIHGSDFVGSLSFDGSINIWDSQSGNVVRTIYNENSGDGIERFVSGAFSPDGSWIAALTQSGDIHRYSLPEGKLLGKFSPPERYLSWGTNQPTSPLLATDGQTLYYAPADNLHKEIIYKLDLNGKVLGKLETNGARGFWRLGDQVIAIGDGGKVVFFSTQTLQRVNELEFDKQFFGIAFDPSGTKLATTSSYGMKVIDANSATVLQDLPFVDGRTHIEFRPVWAGDELYAFGRGNAVTGQKVYQADFDASQTKASEASGVAEFGYPLEDGRLALGGFGSTISVVDPSSGTSLELAGEIGGFTAFATTPSGDLMTGGRQGGVKHWSGKTGQLLRTFQISDIREMLVTKIDVSPDGKRLIAGDQYGDTVCWELETGKSVMKVDGRASGYEGGVLVLKFLDNDHFFRGCDGRLELHSLSGEPLRTWELRGSSIAVDSARQRLASGSSKVGELSLTNKRESVLVQSFPSEVTALLYDTSDLIVGTSSGKLYRWDYSDPESKPELLAEVEGQTIWSILPGTSSWTLLTSGPGYGESIQISKSGQIGPRVRYSGNGLNSLALTPAGRVMARGPNYTLQFYDKESGQKLGALVGVRRNEGWVALETDGHFDGNSEGLQTVTFELGGEVYKVEQFLQQYLRPGSLARLLGETEQAALPREATKLTATTVKKPPKVSIVAPTSGEVIEGDSVVLEFEASDQGAGIGKLTLSHNGHRLPESQIRSLGEGKYEATVNPVKGVNDFSVTAFEAGNSVESRADRCRVTAPHVQERPPKLHLLSIGVDEYQSGLALNLAAVDSESISKQFSSGLYDQGTRLHLTNQEASLRGIREAIARIVEVADPQDAFVFYLAGHGTVVGETYYFLPYDVEIESDAALASSSLSSEDLAKALQEVPATKQLLILDSCKSGAAVGVVGRYYAARSGLEEIRSQQLLAKSSGTFLIAATKADNYAYEIPELGHGVLTFAILEALGKTKSGEPIPARITVNDLLRSVSSRVPALSQEYQGVNQQVLQYSSGQDFLIESRAEAK